MYYYYYSYYYYYYSRVGDVFDAELRRGDEIPASVVNE